MNSALKIGALLVVATSVLGGCASYDSQPLSSGGYPSSAYPAQYQTSNQGQYQGQNQGQYQYQGQNQSYQANAVNYGAIESIEGIRSSPGTSGAGAVVGGLVGGLLGNQVGGGNGKTAATLAGVVGGAYLGNNVEQNRNAPAPDMYQIRIRLDNGDRTAVTQDSVYELRVGDRVRVADGRAYRY
jgi:outer membrane lipoprotein SlyB